jgi:hypothetical protein
VQHSAGCCREKLAGCRERQKGENDENVPAMSMCQPGIEGPATRMHQPGQRFAANVLCVSDKDTLIKLENLANLSLLHPT